MVKIDNLNDPFATVVSVPVSLVPYRHGRQQCMSLQSVLTTVKTFLQVTVEFGDKLGELLDTVRKPSTAAALYSSAGQTAGMRDAPAAAGSSFVCHCQLSAAAAMGHTCILHACSI